MCIRLTSYDVVGDLNPGVTLESTEVLNKT